MKNLIQKWLGIDKLAEACLHLAKENELADAEKEWASLEKQLKALEKEGILLRQMVVSCSHYGRLMKRFIDLSDELKKYRGY